MTTLARAGSDAAATTSEGEALNVAAAPQVIGLDLSLTGTGVAGGHWATTLKGGSLTKNATYLERVRRLKRVRRLIIDHLDGAQLIVIEGPSFHSNDPSKEERAALLYWILARCDAHDIPFAVVAPTTLKVYATGSGAAKKEDVVQAVATRRPDVQFRGNDQADGLVLAAMGLDQLGYPPVPMPQTHRRALTSVTWPDVTP